ncbi:MAG: hypothetical protein SF052_27915 [Bacteroidia bacterium]|nr:hypothetical protein [Bacteroidia bacterium]
MPNKGLFLLSIIVVSLFILLIYRTTATTQEIAERDRKYARINQQADSMFKTLEFQGIVKHVHTGKCGGPKPCIKKILFVRTDSLGSSATPSVIDWGFTQLLRSDSNILIVYTYLKLKDQGAIKMPVHIGDEIRKIKGDATFSLVSKRYNKIYKIPIAVTIETDRAEERDLWEKQTFNF